MADGIPVTTIVGNGGLTPSVLSTVDEWFALKASVRRAVSCRAVCPLRRGEASSEAEMSYSLEGGFATLERGGDDSPARGWVRYPRARRRCGAQSRGLDGSPRVRRKPPRGPRGAWMGRTVSVGRVLGFFESFPFFQIGGRPWAFVGPVALTGVCVLKRSLYPD